MYQFNAMAFRANMNSQFAKTKMCKFELIGCCLKGTSCQFAHDAAEMQALPDLSCTKLCPTLIKNGECNIPGCTFAHDKVEVRATHAFHKTKVCRFFPSGRCERGSKCTFAHSIDELQSQPPTTSTTSPVLNEMNGLESPNLDNDMIKCQARPSPRPSPPKQQVLRDVQSQSNKASANLQANVLPASHQRQGDNLVPAITLLLDRLSDMHETMMAKKLGLTPEMMDGETETETQYSDSQSQGHAEGTSTPTSSENEEDQLIGEAINAHQEHLPSRTIHLFPFVTQKPNFQGSQLTVAPPPGLEVNCSNDTWQSVGVVKTNAIWEAENLFCDM